MQHHWRQMQLLGPCTASELSGRVEAARALSQLLGDDHDIALLRRLVSTPTMVFGSSDDTAAFSEALPQAAQGAAAGSQNARRPTIRRTVAALRGADRSLWLAARSRHREITAEIRPDNVVPFGDLKAGRSS